MPPRKYTAENNRIARARFAKESRDPARDIARKAKMAKSIDDYDPRRNDWKGVDTPGSKKPRKASRRSAPKEKLFSAAEAWRAHVLATHKQMGGSLKDAMRAASKTWIKKGSDPFTNFMAASGAEAPLSVPLPAVAAKPAVDTSYVKELTDLEAMYAPKPVVSLPLPTIPDDDERLPIGTPAEQVAAAADAEEVEEEFHDTNDDETMFQGPLPPVPTEEETAEQMGELPMPPLPSTPIKQAAAEPLPPLPKPPISLPLPTLWKLPPQPSAPPSDDDAIIEEEDLSDLNFPPVPSGDYDADEEYRGYPDLSEYDPVRLQASEVGAESPLAVPLPSIFGPVERIKKTIFG